MNEVATNYAIASGEAPTKTSDYEELMKFVVPFWSKKLNLSPNQLFSISDNDLYQRIHYACQNRYSDEELQLLDEYQAFKELKAAQSHMAEEDARLRAGSHTGRKHAIQTILENAAYDIESSYTGTDNQNRVGMALTSNSPSRGKFKNYELRTRAPSVGSSHLNANPNSLYRHVADIDYGKQAGQQPLNASPHMEQGTYEQYEGEEYIEPSQQNAPMYPTTPSQNEQALDAYSQEQSNLNEYNSLADNFQGVPVASNTRENASHHSSISNNTDRAQLLQRINDLQKERDDLKNLYLDSIHRSNEPYQTEEMNFGQNLNVDSAAPSPTDNMKLCEVITACKKLKDAKDLLTVNISTGGDHVIDQIFQRAAIEIEYLYTHCKYRLNLWLMNHPLWSGILDELAKDIGSNLGSIACAVKCEGNCA